MVREKKMRMNGEATGTKVQTASPEDGADFMAIGRIGLAARHLGVLFDSGRLGALSDGDLLQRFLDRRDGGEAAFETLVGRHGSMVLAVCRQVLGPIDEAEDAFQATFLVLVRRAGTIRKAESLGPWLHGVARRVSLRARRDAARRSRRERSAAFRVVGGPAEDRSFETTLHDEIARLPEKYRTPIVLCDLEGRSHAEAARQLDWPIGTVSGRLSRARTLLRGRLARRGVAPGIGVGALAIGRSARADADRALISRTLALVSGKTSVGASVAGMADAAIRGPMLRLARSIVSALSIGSLAASLGGLPHHASSSSPTCRDSGPVVVREDSALRAPLSGKRRRLADETEILALAFAPDGRTLASGSGDATVTLWDVASGLEKATLRGHQAPVSSLSFSRDGRRLASTSEDRTVKVWDVGTLREEFSVTWLDPRPEPAHDLGPESPDSVPCGPGRDRCADGPAREAASLPDHRA